MGARKASGADALGGLVKGSLAGVAATWAMGPVTTYLYEHESKTARETEAILKALDSVA